MSLGKLVFVLLVSGAVGAATCSYALATNGDGRTNLSAANIPTADFFSGLRSVQHAPLTAALHSTMKEFTRTPRRLAVACWSTADWQSVAGNDANSRNGVSTLGFWTRAQPRWLHLSPQTCDRVQQVIDGEPLTGARAAGLVTPAHEALHAYGIENEAQAECYAVQITPRLAEKLGVDPGKLGLLAKLARSFTRLTAPAGYWNETKCHDGGSWDLYPSRINLGSTGAATKPPPNGHYLGSDLLCDDGYEDRNGRCVRLPAGAAVASTPRPHVPTRARA